MKKKNREAEMLKLIAGESIRYSFLVAIDAKTGKAVIWQPGAVPIGVANVNIQKDDEIRIGDNPEYEVITKAEFQFKKLT